MTEREKVMPLLKWPRGKHNGLKIVGFRLILSINVRCWRLLLPSQYNPSMTIGPLCLRWEIGYQFYEGADK